MWLEEKKQKKQHTSKQCVEKCCQSKSTDKRCVEKGEERRGDKVTK